MIDVDLSLNSFLVKHWDLLVINVEINRVYVVDEMQLRRLLLQHCSLIESDSMMMMLTIELDNHLTMYHHHLRGLPMVDHVHV